MAYVEDLISKITDDDLRSEISREIRKLKKQTNFGLVYEDSVERFLLPDHPIYEGLIVRVPHLSDETDYRVAEKTEDGKFRLENCGGGGATLKPRTIRKTNPR